MHTLVNSSIQSLVRISYKMIGLRFLNRKNAPTPEAKLALPEDLEMPQSDVLAEAIRYV